MMATFCGEMPYACPTENDCTHYRYWIFYHDKSISFDAYLGWYSGFFVVGAGFDVLRISVYGDALCAWVAMFEIFYFMDGNQD